MSMLRWSRLGHLMALLTLLMLGGCGSDRSPGFMFERLLERLANVTEVEAAPAPAVKPLPTYPRPRDLTLPVDDVRVGFGTFLGLGRCRLVGEVSARNSSLGKLQSVTARLLYELRFYRQLQGCLDELRQSNPRDEEFLAEAQAIATRKRANLPAVFWNATFASPEFRTLMNTAAEPLPRDAEPVTADITGALDFITRIGLTLESGTETIDGDALETRYFVLQSGKLIGPLLQGMAVSRDYLERGTRLLETVASQNRLCPMGRKSRQGEYLFNVFQKYYIGEAQPYLSLLHTRARPIVEGVNNLFKTQKAPVPPAFQAFYDATINPGIGTSLWVGFNEDIARHTRAWQRVLGQCDLMPKPPENGTSRGL
jgi:hypothetical protein